jgi:hypothetical protein
MAFSLCVIAGVEIQVAEPQTSTIHRVCGAITVTDPRVISTKDALSNILDRLCRWHRRLCDLVDMVASCYELTLLVVISYCFVNTVIGTYTIITMFRDPHAFVRIPAIVWCCGYGSRLILIGLIPSITVSQVSRYSSRQQTVSELHDLYSLSSIIRIIKARRMRWVGHVVRMGRRGTRIGCWWESQREGGH